MSFGVGREGARGRGRLVELNREPLQSPLLPPPKAALRVS